MLAPEIRPIARLTLTPTPFSAMAGCSKVRDTSSGTMDCHTGVTSAEAAAARKMKARRIFEVTRSSRTKSTKPIIKTVSASRGTDVGSRRCIALDFNSCD
jgi:hypothetical protein